MYEDLGRDKAGTFLRELISKPAFKDDIRAVLKAMEGPDTGRGLVRTFLWQDIEFSLGLMGGLPVIADVLIRMIDELLTQINDKFSPELLGCFVGSLLDEIDKPALGRAVRKLRPIADNLAPLFRQAWQEAMQLDMVGDEIVEERPLFRQMQQGERP